ncbi:MAG TPA: hypothetical protein VFM03_04755 [Candidatus Limnocylindria bacterium]|jgi:hypothetical protein|nr:hypothetical protein [Candidatus Limnocylindria bacterium]
MRITRILRTTAVPSLALALLLAACGGGTSTASQGGDDDGAQATASATQNGDSGDDGGSAGDAGGDAAASVDVTITGGEFEGSYAGSVPDGGCSRGATGSNTFGLQYSTTEDVELSSVQLIVNDADAAASGSEDFQTTFTFGDLLNGTNVDLKPGEGEGSGTVTLDDRGDTATITIEGETADGVGIDATVECHSVFDFGG